MPKTFSFLNSMKSDALTSYQKSAIPSATRVRENQRRSRARRNELIKDLQHRLREYEEKEIHATLVMQFAGRRVNWENTQLRDLLASKGVSGEEIDQFLRSREHDAAHISSKNFPGERIASATAAQSHGVKAIGNLPFGGPIDQTFPMTAQKEIGTRRQTDVEAVNSNFLGPLDSGLEVEIPRRAPHSDEPDYIPLSQGQISVKDKYAFDVPDQICAAGIEQSTMLPAVLDYFCPDPSASNSSKRDSSNLEMSCETAASIISSMRGHESQEQVRSQLGCEGREHCNVQNMKVLQVMEMD